ncbi:NHL repeat containing protein [Nostoc sp. PCC 7107]|nr:NHL repeat containing protein [Nostoc sp. PCC 7107]
MVKRIYDYKELATNYSRSGLVRDSKGHPPISTNNQLYTSWKSCLGWVSCLATTIILHTLPAQATSLIGSDIVVTSAATNGNSQVLRFDGQTGAFLGQFTVGGGVTDPRDILLRESGENVVYVNSGDNRVLTYNATTGAFLGTFASFPNLNPGGSVFGPDGNYYVGARSLGTIARFNGQTGEFIDFFIPPNLVEFPRGFAFGLDGNFYLGNGANPATSSGGGTILKFNGQTGELLNSNFVNDLELSPLDLIVGPDGDIYVSSEYPFGNANSVGTVRRYDSQTGELLAVLDAGIDEQGRPRLSRPRGIGFGPDGNLYVSSTGTGSVVRFNGATGELIDVFAQYPNLNGQALTFVPSQARATVDEPTNVIGLLALAALGIPTALKQKRSMALQRKQL